MASYGEYVSLPGLKASATLAAKQYYAVKLASTAGEVAVCSSGTDVVIGLVQNDPAAGEAADVAALGVALGYASTAITRGTALATNTTGQLETTSTDNYQVIGIALEAATAAGDIIRVLLNGAARY